VSRHHKYFCTISSDWIEAVTMTTEDKKKSGERRKIPVGKVKEETSWKG
jgi:hypothetical protein